MAENWNCVRWVVRVPCWKEFASFHVPPGVVKRLGAVLPYELLAERLTPFLPFHLVPVDWLLLGSVFSWSFSAGGRRSFRVFVPPLDPFLVREFAAVVLGGIFAFDKDPRLPQRVLGH